MVNIMIVTEKIALFKDLINTLRKEKQIQIIVGLIGDDTTIKNVKIQHFNKEESEDDVINSLKKNLLPGKILLLRRPVSLEELTQLLNNTKEIVYLKETRNKFFTFIEKLWQKVELTLFKFTIYEDFSAICFSEQLYMLVKNINQFSSLFKIDNLVGYTKEAIETSSKKVKLNVDKSEPISYLLLYAGIILDTICVVILLGVLTNLSAIFMALISLVALIVIMITLYGVCKEVLYLRVGTLKKIVDGNNEKRRIK